MAKKKKNDNIKWLLAILACGAFVGTVGFTTIGATVIFSQLGVPIFVALFLAGVEASAIGFFVFMGLVKILRKWDKT